MKIGWVVIPVIKNNSLEIVVIEDEEDILELVEYHLQKAGYQTMGFLSTNNVFLTGEKIYFMPVWGVSYKLL